MTTHTRVLQIIAILNTTAAELKTLAASNIANRDAELVFREKAEELGVVVENLEERRKYMLKEEGQYREDRVGSGLPEGEGTP